MVDEFLQSKHICVTPFNWESEYCQCPRSSPPSSPSYYPIPQKIIILTSIPNQFTYSEGHMQWHSNTVLCPFPFARYCVWDSSPLLHKAGSIYSHQCRTVVLNTLENVSRHLLELGDGSWRLDGRGKERCWTYYNAQNYPLQQGIIWLNLSIVPKLKKCYIVFYSMDAP